MKSFKDTEGREWVVKIHVAAAKACRGLVNVDLYALADEGFKGLQKLLGDPITLVDVLYVICREQAEKRGVSDVQFGEAMAGDVLEVAATAFLEELRDFFPNPRVRAEITRVMETGRKIHDRLMDRIEATPIDIDAAVEHLIAQSTISRESSGSTPAPSPGESLT